MSAFETTEMASALRETIPPATNGSGKLSGQELREIGFPEPQPYDYNGAAANPSEAEPAAPGDGGEEAPGWAHNAVKYEWAEEYGDVGPRIPELEAQLFQSEFLNRRGVKFDK